MEKFTYRKLKAKDIFTEEEIEELMELLKPQMTITSNLTPQEAEKVIERLKREFPEKFEERI